MERLLRRLRRWKPDVIHFQWVPLPVVDRFFLQWFRKIAPLVLTVHDTEPYHGAPTSRFQLVGLSSTFQRFDHYIVHTHYSKEALVRQLALPEHRVTVVPHGVFPYYCELVSGLGASGQALKIEGKKKVLFFGVLKPYKGVDVLLEAFARLPEPVAKDTVLQIVGYPWMPVEPLQSLARRLGVESRVSWDLRFVEEKEVALYFTQADVVVLPYRRIDQSGVLMVALAFGKPIVASRVGGFAEILRDGVHGFLVEPGDAESLARALARVLGDCQLRTRMADAVERLAGGELSWNNIAKQTARLYQAVLGARARIIG
jgi:glycosyltransferase involved in cell wall biosynthesis